MLTTAGNHVTSTSHLTERRHILKVGVAATSILAVCGGISIWLPRPIGHDGRLAPPARELFRAIAIAVLRGSLPTVGLDRLKQIDAHIVRLEAVLAAFPAATRSELGALISLLNNAAGRFAITMLRKPWVDLDEAETSAALEMMRNSSSTLRQQTYHALRDLTNAAFYAEPQAWSLMGYPGPTTV